jgi:hypothetical protein
MALNSTPPHLSKKNGAKTAIALSFFSLALTVSASAGSVALRSDATARSECANSCEKVFVRADSYLTRLSPGAPFDGCSGWYLRRRA